MKASLDLHDFSVVNSRLDLLFKLKEHFSNFKVSLFTVPIEIKQDWGPILNRREELEKIKKCLDWMQFIPHGLNHSRTEFSHCNDLVFKSQIIPQIQKAFANDGLPYINGFCAPHWRWNAEIVHALDEMGWWGAIDKRQPGMILTKKYYAYSHCINEPLKGEILKLHGHVYGTRNDLGRCIDNILTLPKDIEWHFVTDFISTEEEEI